MAALDWMSADRSYQVGVDHGVLYLSDMTGIVWNGLISVEEKQEADKRQLYFDGGVSGVIQIGENFSIVVSAFTYPDEFEIYTGYDDIVTKQLRRSFGMSYRVGDATTGQIHLVYNAIAIPSDTSWNSLTEASEMTLFKWDIATRPVEYPNIRPTAHVVIDIASAPIGVIDDLTDILYGTSTTVPRLPDLVEIVENFDNYAIFKVVDNGDGTWTATGPGSYISFTDATTFSITSPTAVMIDATSYTLSSDY
jgi:hypothetical protein